MIRTVIRSQLLRSDTLTTSPEYELRPATSTVEVLAAQRLRYLVFEQEGGANTPGRDGIDADEFDDNCDHLIVWHHGDPAHRPTAVATYRMLPPHANDASPRHTGLYSATEFDLSALESLMPAMVEAGRCAVHPDHRNGATMSLLWGGIARYMFLSGYRYLIGCSSISLSDGGILAAGVWDALRGRHLGSAARWCPPRVRWQGPVAASRVKTPALLRGYLRLGAVVLSEPAFDGAFNTADLLVLLDLQNVDQRYLRFFLPDSSVSDMNGLR